MFRPLSCTSQNSQSSWTPRKGKFLIFPPFENYRSESRRDRGSWPSELQPGEYPFTVITGGSLIAFSFFRRLSYCRKHQPSCYQSRVSLCSQGLNSSSCLPVILELPWYSLKGMPFSKSSRFCSVFLKQSFSARLSVVIESCKGFAMHQHYHD